MLMQRTFSYMLLITYILFLFSCNPHFVQTDVNAANIEVSDNINDIDSGIVQIYLPYKKTIEKDMSRVISVSENEMIKNKPESSLTNFLADLLLAEGKKETENSGFGFQPDVSYVNYGGIRTFLPEGEITVGKIYELMPFENEMVFLKLTGIQLQDFLNIIAERGGDSVGGVQFVISDNKAIQVKINEIPLNPVADYWLVTNDYVAGGGDDLEILTRRSELVESGKKIRNVIISFMENKQQDGEMLTANADGRIVYE